MIVAKRGWHLLHISGTLIHVWNCHSSFSLRCSHASVIVSFFIRGWAHFVNAMLDFRIGSQKCYFKNDLDSFSFHLFSVPKTIYFYLHSGSCFFFRWRSIFIVTIIILFIYSKHVMHKSTTDLLSLSFLHSTFRSLYFLLSTPNMRIHCSFVSAKKNPKNETIIIKMSDINPLFYTFHVAMHTLAHMWDNKMKNKK